MNDFGLTFCDHCGLPNEIHMGFDHGKGKCLVSTNGLGLSLRIPKSRERADTLRRVNLWFEQQEALEWAGSGI